jgi:hypothetical protein
MITFQVIRPEFLEIIIGFNTPAVFREHQMTFDNRDPVGRPDAEGILNWVATIAVCFICLWATALPMSIPL